jgi:SAM-dependent methyltransferase
MMEPDQGDRRGPRGRRNELTREHETWQPPPLEPGHGRIGRLAASARRFLDVQAGSVWNDLRGELGSARGVVLDIGCGAQPLRELLPADVTYIGIDIAESQDRFGYRTPDTRYFEGNVWPVEDASVDLAFATETLEHVDDPPQFLSEAFRVLRPGGRLVLTVPFSARYHFVPYDYWRYTPASLEMLLRDAGLTDVEVYARGNAVTVAAYKDMALILPLLLPQSGTARQKLVRRVAGVAASPLLLALATVANISLRRDGGDDCLGYTTFAVRPSE